MSLVIAGHLVPLAPGAEDETFDGRVWIGDDGLVAAVTRSGQAAPSGFDGAPVVDVGGDLVLPGFVDLHSHIGYNTLPLWTQPGEAAPYAHRDIWPNRKTYKPDVAWPAWTLSNAAPETMYAYVQTRALAGGTTAIQGWPAASRPPTNRLVRSVDDDQVGPLRDPVAVSLQALEKEQLQRRAKEVLGTGRSFVYHLAEGQVGSLAARDFDAMSGPGWTCLKPGFVAIHANALDAAAFRTWAQKAEAPAGSTAGTVVWSPLSNLWLYGSTTAVPDVRAAGIGVALGTDWGPSGTKNQLGEIKVARVWSDHQGWGLTDADLVRMITTTPGDALARAWKVPVGRLVPGGLGDVAVLSRRGGDVWHDVVAARDADVSLVVVGGRPRFGTAALLKAGGAANTTAVPVGTARRRVTLVRPDDPSKTWSWKDVLARLDSVRADAAVNPPRGAAGLRAAAGAPGAGDPPGTPVIAVRLDMPGGPGATAGPPPKGQTVDIPPIEPLNHSRAWLASLKGRGFHGGVLDGLRSFYG
ncbi:MAG TPA: hypothetical protein VFJ85_06640 [Acidimicrobiales bacterium]|nr:hypothetical protein [Acidimicrobiales bacterium]